MSTPVGPVIDRAERHGGNTSQGPSMAERGQKGGNSTLAKHPKQFSQMGKLSREIHKARKSKSQLPPEWQAFVDMLNGTGSQVIEKDSAVDIDMNTDA